MVYAERMFTGWIVSKCIVVGGGGRLMNDGKVGELTNARKCGPLLRRRTNAQSNRIMAVTELGLGCGCGCGHNSLYEIGLVSLSMHEGVFRFSRQKTPFFVKAVDNRISQMTGITGCWLTNSFPAGVDLYLLLM